MAFADPWGLWAGTGDSIKVKVMVCEGGREVEREISAAVHTQASNPALLNSIPGVITGVTFAGSSSDAALGNQAVAALGNSLDAYHAVAVFPTTLNGNPVLSAAGTGCTSDGGDPCLVLRADMAAMTQTGNVNRFLAAPKGGFSTIRGCHALGHEGVHMGREPARRRRVGCKEAFDASSVA